MIDPEGDVSVIIPAYNAEAYIEQAIASAMGQVPAPREIIVVNDGSVDQTAAKVKQFSLVSFIDQPNLGVSAARNAGIAAASGTYLAFLDADDLLLPNGLLANREALEADARRAMVYGGLEEIGPDGRHLAWNDLSERVLTPRDIFFGAHPTPSQAMVRREAVVDAGGFSTDLSYAEDQDLWLRLLAQGGTIFCTGKRVSVRRRHAGQATQNTVAIYKSWFTIVAKHQKLIGNEVIDHATWGAIRNYLKRVGGRYLPFYMRRAALGRDWRSVVRAGTFYTATLPHSLMGTIDTLRGLVVRRAARASSASPASTQDGADIPFLG